MFLRFLTTLRFLKYHLMPMFLKFPQNHLSLRFLTFLKNHLHLLCLMYLPNRSFLHFRSNLRFRL
jgi:hypothetical protein